MLKKTLNTMCNKLVQFCCLLSLLFICFWPQNLTQVAAHSETKESIKVLVVYSTVDGMLNETVRILDLLLGHFTTQLHFIADEDLSSADLLEISHLVYYGTVDKKLPTESKRLMSQFPGPFLAIGLNIEQLDERFSFLTFNQKVEINKVTKRDDSPFQSLEYNYSIPEVQLLEGEALIQGWKGEHSVPLYMEYGESAYFAGVKLDAPLNIFLGQGLHSFFLQAHAREHLAYIRLEDVHPFSDPALVRATGEYLAEKEIPFLIALIPIYTNPETLKRYHLRDMPELVEVLRDLQDQGASIILHGYTHQYRSSETGEGFEFWDVENNRPISAPPDEEVTSLYRHDFLSKEEYELYLEDLAQFDRNYTRERIEQGIRELTELGLYPVGFEAPHYTMSQEGYKVVSEYFTYLFGQVQLGDRNWQHMTASPYVSKPAFLHGMTLLPETIGYYDPESKTPLDDIQRNIKQMRFVDDGFIGLFYHPYLGVEHLQDLIALVETIPDLKWIDLGNMDIHVSEKFEALNRSNLTDKPYLNQVLIKIEDMGIVQLLLWAIVVLVSIAIIAFSLYTLRLRFSLRKKLFEERNVHG